MTIRPSTLNEITTTWRNSACKLAGLQEIVMSQPEIVTAERMRHHVERLAGDIGERNIFRPAALALSRPFGLPLEHVATFRFVPGVAWSDHRSFWRHGYRALMVTDTAFYRNPHYHRAGDTPDKLAYPQLAHVTEGLFRSLAVLARQGFDPA
jgi:hypothetical protein